MTGVPMQKDLLTGRYRKVYVPQRESKLHIQLVTMLRWCLRPDVIMRHVPNGEHRDPRTAAKLKAMGVLPGSADLEFHWCEIPLRRPQNIAQSEFALAVRLLGDEYHVVRSIDQAITILGERGLLRSDVEVCGRRW